MSFGGIKMKFTLEDKIKRLISYISKNPGIDVAYAADEFLPGNAEMASPKDMIVPDLLKLPPAKRALLVNLVRKKTNYNLYSSDDYNKNYINFKEIGEVAREIPHFAKKIKWFFQ
jgi:hypothetical protein